VTGAVVSGGLVAPVLLMAGLAQTPAATASIITNLEVIATVAFAAVLVRRSPGRRILAGMALVVAAGIVVAGGGDTRIGLGPLLVAGAAVAWGVDNTFTAAIDDIRPERIVAIKGAVAGPVNLALGLALDGSDGLGVQSAVLVMVLGATGYGLSLVWWIRSARVLGAARTQVLFATAPVFGVALAWLALGDPVLRAQLFALGLAALGVTAATLPSSAESSDH
jgi:drug/metabolite transporter (DMT)-like permease